MRRVAWAGGLVLGISLWLAQPAHALITRLTPLKDVLAESQFIVTAKVESLAPDKPAVVLTVDADLKGKAPFRRLPINLTGDSEAQKEKHTPQLLKRLAPKLPLVLFVNQRGKRFITFAYTNGTWFQLTGQQDGDAVRWSFAHCEPYLRRTFKGTTEEMQQAVTDGLAGKRSPPEPDAKEPPGLGPEVNQGLAAGRRPAGPRPAAKPVLFAVIPTLGIGGPLALLALLFPSVFGGMTGQLKRWLAALTVLSTNATLLMLHDWFASSLSGWWASPATLWAAMTVIAVLGLLWAWKRNLSRPTDASPGRGEVIALWVLSLCGVGLLAYCLYNRLSLLDSPWRAVVALWSGIWLATIPVTASWLRGRRGEFIALSSEGMMLAGILLAFILLGATSVTRGEALVAAEDGHAEGGRVPQFRGVQWTFMAPEKGHIESSPLALGHRVYVAVAHDDAFAPYGTLYWLDRDTGKVRWRFDDDKEMKQVFSTPAVADGRLYVGEGFHQDRDCKLYCLNADTGTKLWEFKTQSHVESSPCVVNGKVYFGAGDDGLYCLDAATGKELWHFKDLHVDASPVVVGTRLYCGSGVGDLFQATERFCLDAETGQEVWRYPTSLPVWGSPAPAGKHVYYPLGNGNFLESADTPGGALLCIDAASGKVVWQYDVPDAVLGNPAVDAQNVYFGSRDRHCYCVSRKNGDLVWKLDVGSPVVASPALVSCKECGHSTNLYVVGTEGRVCCLDARTGQAHWQFELYQHAQKRARLLSSPALTVFPDETGERHRLYVGVGHNNVASWSAALYCLEDETND